MVTRCSHFTAILLLVSLFSPLFLVAQEKPFTRQLKASGYLQTTLKPDSSDMGYVRWQKKKPLESRSLPLAADIKALQYKGPGGIRIASGVDARAEQAIEMAAPSSLPVKNPSNRSYAFAEVIRPLAQENLERYNRISVWVKLDAPGFYSAFAGLTLYNEGTHIIPVPGRFEGQHFVTVYPRQWMQLIWEIPDLYRDKVTGISVSLMLGGSPAGASDSLKLLIRDLRIEKVKPENTRGFDLREGAMAFSHTGYTTGSRKQALVQQAVSKDFQLLDEKGNVAYSGKGKELKNGFVLLDFSPFEKPGQYRIRHGQLLSGYFPIGSNAYLSTAWKTLNFFFAERCGYDQPGIHQECHKDVFCVHPDGRKIPVNGGWHDAADLTQGLGNTARGVNAMLELAAAVQKREPELSRRALEEARWGLNWILNTRFGDGYRQGGLIVGIWTDNQIGTKDDMESKATRSPLDNLQSALTTARAVPFFQQLDPVFANWCREAAIADFKFGTERLSEVVTEKNEVEVYALAAWAAARLYQLTQESLYLEKAAAYADVVMECQELKKHDEWSMPLRGFFYASRKKQRPLEYFHQSQEEVNIKALTELLQLAPTHPRAMEWRTACMAYADYLKSIAEVIPPYGILPAAVYQLDNADFKGIYHEGDQVGMPSMEEYNAQVKNGILLGGNYYLRRFPVAYQFRGFHGVLLGKAQAALLLSALLKDESLRNIGTRQMEYVAGFNPFAMSTIYGEGYDYPPLYGAYLGDVVGAVPVGIETFENEDAPYMPMQVNATYKEVWTHTTASVMWIAAWELGR